MSGCVYFCVYVCVFLGLVYQLLRLAHQTVVDPLGCWSGALLCHLSDMDACTQFDVQYVYVCIYSMYGHEW